MGLEHDGRAGERGEGTGMGARPTIGILLTDIENELENELAQGVVAVAEEVGANVVCFAGSELQPGSLRNTIFEYATRERLDGLVISTLIRRVVTRDQLLQFCARYSDLPMVTGVLGLPNVPYVAADNFGGMYELVSHLIEAHGYRRIAFITGPEGHPEAEARFGGYRAALEDHDVPFDAALVAQGDFLLPTGQEAMAELLERNVAFDVVVGANDETAAGAYRVLMERGLQIPTDVALAGFDDAAVARTLVPPLTSVRQSFVEMGRVAARVLMGLLGSSTPSAGPEAPSAGPEAPSAGPEAPSAEPASTDEAEGGLMHLARAEVVVRRSCGCVSEVVRRVVQEDEPRLQEEGVALWNALGADLSHGTARFLEEVETQLHRLYEQRGDVDTFQDVLSDVRRQWLQEGFQNEVPAPAVVRRADDLIHQARVMVGETTQLIESARVADAQAEATLVRDFSTAVASEIEMERLLGPIERAFPELGIREAYVVLDDGDGSDRGRLALAYRDGVGVRMMDESLELRRLVPDPLFPVAQRFSWVVLPLVLRDQQFGYVLLEYVSGSTRTALDRSAYRQIADALSSALFRAQLVAEMEHARERAEASLAEISRTREISDRLQQAPDTEAVLRIALEELGEMLGASRSVVRLGTRAQLLGHSDSADRMDPTDGADGEELGR